MFPIIPFSPYQFNYIFICKGLFYKPSIIALNFPFEAHFTKRITNILSKNVNYL